MRSPSSASPTSKCPPPPSASGARSPATATPLTRAQPGEAVGAPFFAADPVMREEEPVRVVFLLDRQQSRIVWAPIRGLPLLLEEVALCEIGTSPRRDLFELAHRFADPASITAIQIEVWLVTGKPGESRRVFAGDDREHEGDEHVRVHRRVPGGGRRLFRSSGESLLEMELDRPMPAGGEQRVREGISPARLEQRSGQPKRLEAGDKMA